MKRVAELIGTEKPTHLVQVQDDSGGFNLMDFNAIKQWVHGRMGGS